MRRFCSTAKHWSPLLLHLSPDICPTDHSELVINRIIALLIGTEIRVTIGFVHPTRPNAHLTSNPTHCMTATAGNLSTPWSHRGNNRYPLSDSRMIMSRGTSAARRNSPRISVSLSSVLHRFSSVRLKGAVRNQARALFSWTSSIQALSQTTHTHSSSYTHEAGSPVSRA